MHRDPWERYTVLDAGYYLPILINNLYLSADEQALIVWMISYSVENDLVSFWDLPQTELVAEFLQFCKDHKVYLGEQNIFSFLDFYNSSGYKEGKTGLNPMLDELVVVFYDLMREQGKLREFKKDYSD